MQESRIKCGIPGGIKFSSQVGKVGSHHLRRDPAIPTWDPGWDCRDPAYIPPDILPGDEGLRLESSAMKLFTVANSLNIFRED